MDQKQIDKIADKHHDIIVERMTQSGHGDDMKKVVEKLLSDGVEPLELPGWHVVRGMRDLRKIDPDNKKKAIDLTFAQRCIAWSAAAIECGETLNAVEKEEYELCKKIWGTALFVLKDGSVAWLDVPKEHHIRDSDGALHNPNGPAILFDDGSKTYAQDDIFNIPEWVIETTPAKMDPAKIMELKNMDHRRIAIQKIGIEKMMSGSKIIHEEKETCYILRDMQHLFPNVETAPHLEMVCPSNSGTHLEGVSEECKTVQDALDFRASGAGFVGAWRPRTIDGFEQKNGIEGQHQQGDVNMLKVDAIPQNFKEINKKTVLSDANQKRHSITGGKLYQKGDDQSVQYWCVVGEQSLVHESDHQPEIHKDCIFKLWPVVAKDFLSGLVEPVID